MQAMKMCTTLYQNNVWLTPYQGISFIRDSKIKVFFLLFRKNKIYVPFVITCWLGLDVKRRSNNWKKIQNNKDFSPFFFEIKAYVSQTYYLLVLLLKCCAKKHEFVMFFACFQNKIYRYNLFQIESEKYICIDNSK